MSSVVFGNFGVFFVGVQFFWCFTGVSSHPGLIQRFLALNRRVVELIKTLNSKAHDNYLN